jgi:AcrR family transcriptional regulator
MPLQLYEKEKILDACFSAFAKDGYEHTSTAALAKAAGVSKALLFHHFGSKKELYLQALDRMFERGKAEMGFDKSTENENFFQLRERASIAKFEYYKRNPEMHTFIKEAFYNTPTELKPEIEQKYGALMARREREMELQFEKVPLRRGVNREQALRLVKLTLEYFEDRYLTEQAGRDDLDETYLQKFMEERNDFLSMLRYGIEEQEN